MTDDDPSRRTDPRDSVMLTAVVRHEQGGEFSARVRNISAGGARIECPRGLPVATPVTLTMRGVGSVPGTVAWSAGGFVGVRFDTLIDPKLTMPQVPGRDPSAPVHRREFKRPGLKPSDD